MRSTAIVLAAGEGTRMKSRLPKVAHRVLGVPLVEHVVDAARAAGIDRIVVVTGHNAEIVEALLDGVEFARQEEQAGTGHAVMCALDATGPLTGPVVVLAGDVPLIRPETIARLVEAQAVSGAACVLLSAEFADPAGYGRVVRDPDGRVAAIVEDRDLEPEQRSIRECNVGLYCFDGAALGMHLRGLGTDNAQGEYYLTDLVALLVSAGLGVEAVVSDDTDESRGVNSRVQLAEVSCALQKRINHRHMLAGVSMPDPALVWIGPHVTLGIDVVLEPMTFLLGETEVADECVVGSGSRIVDSAIGAGTVVDSSIVEGARVGARVHIGPWVRVSPGTEIADDVTIGTDGTL